MADRKQMWADKKFVLKMNVIKAKRIVNTNGKEEIALPDLTKELMNNPLFKEIEIELTKGKEIRKEIKIKLDKRLPR